MLFRGVIVGAASGKLGSMVASHNKGGQYMRARVVPSGAVASPFQAVVRNSLASLSSAWSSELDEDQRAAWENYALNVPGTNRLGDSIQLSGQNWFIGCNTPRLQAGLDRVDDAPVIFDRGNISMFPVVEALNDTGGTITFGSTLTADAVIMVYQGRPFSPGRGKYYGSMRLATTDTLTGGMGSITFAPPFPTGGSANQTAFNLVITYDDGRLSTPFRVTFP